jgi:glycosyltransferase involved in cell wall biosynthesis
MRVLHIIDSGGLYGAEVMILNLMVEQAKLGVQPMLASIGEKGVQQKEIEVEAARRGIIVEAFRMRRGPNFLGARAVLHYARCERADLLHSHGYKANILFGFLPRTLRKLPIVTTLHGWTSAVTSGRLRLYEWLDKHSLRFIDAVVLVSGSMMGLAALKGCDAAKVHVVQNGIPGAEHEIKGPIVGSCNGGISADTNADPAILRFCRRAPTVGSVGRLSFEKGYLNLIDAIRSLRERDIDIQLIIIGEGPERPFLENRVKQTGLGKFVCLPGYRQNARDYIPFFKIYSLPSLTEGLPVSVLEAMAAGVPIVATPVGGVPDLLEDGLGGVLTDSTSNNDISAGILKVILNPDMAAKMAERSRIMVKRFYSIEATARGYLDIYSSVLSK